MKPRTWYFYVAIFLWLSGMVVAVLWLREATTVGIGFISKYLAPIGFGAPIFASLLLFMDSRARR